MMKKPVVLVVEDDERSARLMHDVLEHEGLEVLVTDSGELALTLTRLHHPAFVLMDIHLPGISGFDALREIRADASIAHTPVVAVTAAVVGNPQQLYASAGFDAFQPKPIILREFLGTIRKLIAA